MYIPDGQEDCVNIVLKKGKTMDVWKENGRIMKYTWSPSGCNSCAEGKCSKIEVILDGDVEDEWSFFAGKYQKANICLTSPTIRRILHCIQMF